MATYRYSKYDKAKTSDKWLKKLFKSARKRIPSLGRKPLNLKMSDYYTQKPTKDNAKHSFNFSTLGKRLAKIFSLKNQVIFASAGVFIAYLVLKLYFGHENTIPSSAHVDSIDSEEVLIGIFSLFAIPLAIGGGSWVIYQFFKWRSSCPTCKAPWKRELIDKTFLGTYDTRYDNDSGTIKHRNRYLEKYRCGNCGCTSSQEVTDWL